MYVIKCDKCGCDICAGNDEFEQKNLDNVLRAKLYSKEKVDRQYVLCGNCIKQVVEVIEGE